ncbi:hypothetical protein WDW37_15725 [Bdellovibrionota bacterium FG-1]
MRRGRSVFFQRCSVLSLVGGVFLFLSGACLGDEPRRTAVLRFPWTYPVAATQTCPGTAGFSRESFLTGSSYILLKTVDQMNEREGVKAVSLAEQAQSLGLDLNISESRVTRVRLDKVGPDTYQVAVGNKEAPAFVARGGRAGEGVLRGSVEGPHGLRSSGTITSFGNTVISNYFGFPIVKIPLPNGGHILALAEQVSHVAPFPGRGVGVEFGGGPGLVYETPLFPESQPVRFHLSGGPGGGNLMRPGIVGAEFLFEVGGGFF